MIFGLLACTASLLPEGVEPVPGRVDAELLQGGPGFGAWLAWVDGELAVGGDGGIQWQGEWTEAPELRGLWAGPMGPRYATGQAIVDLADGELARVDGLRAASGDGEDWIASGPQSLRFPEQVLELASEPWGVEMGPDGWLARVCEGADCVLWWMADGEPRVSLGESERGGPLAFAPDGTPLQGFPGAQDGSGRVDAGEDTLIEGEGQQGMGSGLCGRFAAGVHDLHAMPNHTRVLALRGEGGFALEAGAPWGRTTLACDGEHLAIGQPGFEGGGRVWVLPIAP